MQHDASQPPRTAHSHAAGQGVRLPAAQEASQQQQQPTCAHIWAVPQGVQLPAEPVELLCYDDGTGCVLACAGGSVTAYRLPAAAASSAPQAQVQPLWTRPLQEGPPPLAMRCTLDGRTLAVQRSAILLELVNLATGAIFLHATRKGRSGLVAWFFTEAPERELVLVTAGGLETASFVGPGRQSLKASSALRLPPVAWCVHTHETRVALLGCGPAGADIHGWQLTAAAMMPLPLFTIRSAPMPGAAINPVTASHVRVLKLYGRVYCAYINFERSVLELYRTYTDAVVMQRTWDLFSPCIELSVVDNVVACHYLDTGVVVLLDGLAETGDLPVANPLPLAMLRPAALDDGGSGGGNSSDEPARPPPEAAPAASGVVLQPGSCSFHLPDLVMDHAAGAVYRLHLDLPALASAMSSEHLLLAGFLQRRRPAPVPQLAAEPRGLLVQALRGAVEARAPLRLLRRVFDSHVQAYQAALTAAGPAAAPASSPNPSASASASTRPAFGSFAHPSAMSPAEVVEQVLQSLLEEQAVDAPWLQAVVSQYKCCLSSWGQALPAQLHELSLELSLRLFQQHQLALLLRCQPGQAQAGALAQRLLQRAAAAPTAGCALLLPLAAAAAAQEAAEALLAATGDRSAVDGQTQALLRQGDVLAAAALASRCGTSAALAGEIVEAAGRQGRLAPFVAVHRAVCRWLPTNVNSFEAARAAYMQL